MTSKPQRRNGYDNPATLPVATRCLKIIIPDDDYYRNAVFAQLTMLGKWWSWKRDNDDKAKDTAQTWRDFFALEEECGIMNCDDVIACLESDPTWSLVVSRLTSVEGGLADNNTRDDGQDDDLDQLHENPQNGTIYPPAPDAGTDEACGSANYIVEQLRIFIASVEDEVVAAGNPWEALEILLDVFVLLGAGLLLALINAFYADPTSILTTYDANSGLLIDYLHCVSTSKADFTAFLIAQGLDDIASYVDCLTQQAWDKWAFIGASNTSSVCYTCGLPDCVETDHLSGVGWHIDLYNIGTVIEPIVVDGSFGNSAPSFKAGFIQTGTNYGREISVWLRFDQPVLFHGGSMDYWFNDAGNNSAKRRIALLNEDGTVAYGAQETTENNAVKSAWTTYAWTGGDVELVWSIRFLFYHLGGNTAIFNTAAATAWLDNICVDIEPYEQRAPMVGFVSEVDGWVGRGIIQKRDDLGSDYWQLTSIEPDPDANWIYIRDIQHREFKIDNLTVALPVLRWLGVDSLHGVYNQYSDWSAGATMLEYGMIRALPSAAQVITFRMFAP